MSKHHDKVTKHLSQLKEEGIENQASEDRSSFGKALIVIGGIVLVLLMFSFALVSYPVGDFILGRLQSSEFQGTVLTLGDLRVEFDQTTYAELQGMYFDNQKTEFSVCLIGEKKGDTYKISSLYVPLTFEQSFSHVRHEPCNAETIILLHTHPYRSCRASAVDIDTLERTKLRNPDVLMAVMCEPQRVSLYQ